MIAVDTSVVVAAFASWHVLHQAALAVLDRQPALPVQAALEAYSVLTRLPPPHRAPADVVRDFIDGNFGDAMLSLAPDQFAGFLSEMALQDIIGGATYDAVIAVTARDAGRDLVTCDARARKTYERLGISVEYIR
ncbi:MAG: PIN domain-containing protein [Candidatus Limnocylindrales bacterium]